MHTKSDTMDISLEMNVSTKYSSHIQTYMYDFKQSTRTDRGGTIIKLKPAVSNLVQISKCLNTSFSQHETMTKYHITFKLMSGI